MDSLDTEWDCERSLGVEIGVIKGNVGERGVQLVGLLYFLVVGVE